VEDNAWLVQSIAGVAYVLAGAPLLKLAARSGETPERMLGATFLMMGISYGFYQGPLVFDQLEPLWTPFYFVGRLLYDASVITVGFFTRAVFRREEHWAWGLVWASVASIAAGLVVSARYGDWEGLYPISNPGYWLEFAGQSLPCLWIAVEGFLHFRKSKKRMHFGLSDPMVCNRFLLWSLFGVMQWATILVLVKMNSEFEIHEKFSASMDALEGAFEMLAILMVWLAFFPPRLYRSWIDGGLAHAGQPGRG